MNPEFVLIKKFYRQLMPELADSSWLELEKLFERKTVRKGDFVLKAGETADFVTFVNKGVGRLYYTVEGKEIVAGFFKEGEYIADYSSFLTRTPALCSIDAIEDAEILNLSYYNLQLAYQTYPEFQKFGRLIAEYLFIMVSDRTSTLLLKAPEERYLDFLEKSADLIQRVPQYMIASYLGVTPEALSRIRKRLAR